MSVGQCLEYLFLTLFQSPKVFTCHNEELLLRLENEGLSAATIYLLNTEKALTIDLVKDQNPHERF